MSDIDLATWALSDDFVARHFPRPCRFEESAHRHDNRIPRPVRVEVLKRADRRCELCRGAGDDMHHVNYPGYGNETAADLLLLCRACHKREHGIP